MFTAWFLVVLYLAIPHLRMNGKPWMLFDLPRRQFTFFGTTFMPTDSILLMLLMVGILLGIFLLTALLGRAWCGWGCPQTVYMEYLFRPLERLIEGDYVTQHRMDRAGGFKPRRLVKHLLFLLISIVLANTFLAYWVGTDTLLVWITGSPPDHLAGFLVMLVTSGLVFVDFAYFREQTCIVACPYGRFQSVLLDTDSLIVAYDRRRGEPRKKLRKGKRAEESGDCIDCNHCVAVCPTGIDIREGLQLECIHCTQCIDACDDVMDKIGYPRGLVRYGSQSEIETGRRRFFRPRLVFYPALLALIFGLMAMQLAARESAEVTMLRGLGDPYAVLNDGGISNAVRIKIWNRANETRSYWLRLDEPENARMIAPLNPLVVEGGKMASAGVFVVAGREEFSRGFAQAVFAITDSVEFSEQRECRLLGPGIGD